MFYRWWEQTEIDWRLARETNERAEAAGERTTTETSGTTTATPETELSDSETGWGRRSHWGPVAPVGQNGAGRKSKSYTHPADDRRYTGFCSSSKLRLKEGTESRGIHSLCSGMELHHPIMSKLWDLGGQTKIKKERM